MRILIVEDQEEKCSDIISFLNEEIGENVDFTHKLSLRAGLAEVVSGIHYSCLLLDMSMPSFDPSPSNPEGSKPKSFAGRELMAQMSIRDISIPTIVITQYSRFDGGAVDLKGLTAELKKSYGQFFLGSIFYSSVSPEWKEKLSILIKEVK